MIKDKIQKALNQQINAEFYSSYEYLAMSAYFESVNLSGFAQWMKLQSQEEYGHAMKIYDYMQQVDGKISLMKIDPPSGGWKSPLDVFKETYAHEQKVTKAIYALVELAMNEKDFATNNFLQWFVNEQVEEESTALKILERIKLIGDNKSALFLLDREMSQRTSSPEA